MHAHVATIANVLPSSIFVVAPLRLVLFIAYLMIASLTGRVQRVPWRGAGESELPRGVPLQLRRLCPEGRRYVVALGSCSP